MAVLTVLQSWGMLACLGIFASGLAYLLATLTGKWNAEGEGEDNDDSC